MTDTEDDENRHPPVLHGGIRVNCFGISMRSDQAAIAAEALHEGGCLYGWSTIAREKARP